MARRAHISVPRETWIYLTILAVVIVGAILREINLLIILAGLMFGSIVDQLALDSSHAQEAHDFTEVATRCVSG